MDSWVESLITDLSEDMKKQGINITSIILFGSQFEGTATNESDIDLAIVSPSFTGLSSLERRKKCKKSIRHIIDIYKIPVDLILLTPNEYENENSLRMSFIRQGISVPVLA
ncbi:nucleotidyltransferase domain-containing protein [Methanospirillum sp. J.3.6.1-F.2.7.3]|jgi:predicted nucleotidyltransferase|uniref:Nucleotidyltransferase domain-containing protein n=2 Tax=Methanospirillum TaxID=2202 RepID=A0A8E7AW89_9EURY|nr:MULTISPECIES: nucleotidyltransferase domain-containing protein [Methanospirillum]MDX8551324.1 nucleotidyltransferase domain-containing protein [Methanospirillum hungatei]QVV87910.1 nucleotidyltransferase domain-containing protein [Methanospirillum sp. J.3.6.1-F.2.7.3]QXO95388.1 nucleotidyltransferase domain-containing protein [Methanospirillum hungatei]